MKVAVFGGNGQLGSDLVAHLRQRGDEPVALVHSDADVTDAGAVRRVLAAAAPDAVVNTAAFHHLGRCEDDPGRAFAVNATGALHVARAATELGAACVYVSTDYVFDGAAREPYGEDACPRPLSVYGASKLAGEHLTLAAAPRGLVVRVSGIYGRLPSRDKGDNFVTMILRRAREQAEVKVVDDESLAPTSTTEIARAIADLLHVGAAPGVYHAACGEGCSWHDFAAAIFAERGVTTPLLRAKVADFPGPLRRPAYSVLGGSALRDAGVAPLPHWRDAVAAFLRANPQVGARPATG
jgi:dTDP-4-dehydrorhamnose reductase